MPTKQKVLLSDIIQNKQDDGVNFGNEDEAASMTLVHLSSVLASNPRPLATIKKGENEFTGVRTRPPSLRRPTAKKAKLSFGSDSSDESSQSDTEKEAVTGCKCKSSSCLKLYCTCFHQGSYCLGTCGCDNCLNTADNDGPSGIRTLAIQEILGRKPLAFGQKGPEMQLALKSSENAKNASNSSPAMDQILSSDASSSSSASYKEVKKAPSQRYRGAVRTKGGVNGCRCAKTKCLKLYCPCFEKGVVCLDDCSCVNCMNTTEESGPDGIRTKTIEEILLRRPLAFDKRVGDTNDIGCICKKTRCLKKYCICFSAGIACNSSKCKCLDCGNGGDEESVASSNQTPLQNETIAPFAELVEFKCVDAEQPLMIDEPPMPLLDVCTLIEEV